MRCHSKEMDQWNAAYSEQDLLLAAAWKERLKILHSETATRTLIEMILAKKKWGVMYSEEQEKMIGRVQAWLAKPVPRRTLSTSFGGQKHETQHGEEE